MLNRNLRTQEEAATIAAVAYATATADGGTITTATTEDLDKLKPNEKKKPKEVEELIISRRAYKRFFFKQLDVVRRLVAELPASDQKQYDITVESKKLKSKWFNYEESMNKIIQNEQADETTIEEETVRLNADQEELDEIKTQLQLKKEVFNAQKENGRQRSWALYRKLLKQAHPTRHWELQKNTELTERRRRWESQQADGSGSSG